MSVVVAVPIARMTALMAKADVAALWWVGAVAVAVAVAVASASTMKLWHHFYSSSEPESPNLGATWPA